MIGLLQERPPYIRFEIGTMEARDDNGVPIVKDVELVKVTPAGSKDVHEAIAEEWIKGKEDLAKRNPPEYNPDWAVRFRQSFELWRKGQEIPTDGTPVRSWPALSPAEVRRCVEANILTVEDLAQANEQSLARLGMGSRALKVKAMTWLEDADRAKASQKTAALEVQNETLREQVEKLSASLEALTARLAQDEQPKRSRRGKPDLDDGGDAIR